MSGASKGRLNCKNLITERLAFISSRVDVENGNHYTDFNTILEQTYCGLLNMTFGWNLVNANDRQMNTPAVDLVDEERGIAVQISSTARSEKIQSSFRTFFQHNLHEKYNELYFIFISSRLPKKKNYDEHLQFGFRFDFDKHVWNNRKLVKKIQSLGMDQMNAIADYLTAETGMEQTTVPAAQEYWPSLKSVAQFYIDESRDSQIIEMMKTLELHRQLFLFGPGGIGKTQVALMLAHRHFPENSTYIKYTASPYDGEDAMVATLLNAELGDRCCPHTNPDLRRTEFKRRIDLIRDHSKEMVFIIDDFWLPGSTVNDLRQEKSFEKLVDTGAYLIFTTRFRFPSQFSHEITALQEDQLIAQIQKHCDGVALPYDSLLPLVKAVDCHTLMADLIAQTLKDGIILPDELLEVLVNGLPAGLVLPDVENDKTQKRATLLEHIYELYDIDELSEDARQVLALTLLIPSDGMDISPFNRCLSRRQLDLMRELRAVGWVNVKDSILTVSPVIRLICRGRLAPGQDALRPFLEQMCARWGEARTTEPQRCQIRSYFDAASDWFSGDLQMQTWYNEIINNTEGG